MAYTYEQFLEAANKAGLANRFTQQEMAAAKNSPEFGISLMGLIRDEQNATTEEQRLLAAEAANQMRKSYGVMNAVAESNPGVADTNQDRYAGLLDQANTQSSFTYDPEQDPTWSAYKKQYAREGERASANAMAQAAAMSGGVPSSYALTAAQQQGNYYAGQMNDIIPELEQNAYQRYLYEQQMKQQEFDNALNLYQALGYATPEIEQILGIGESGKEGSNAGDGVHTPVTEEDLYGDMLRELSVDDAPAEDGTGNYTTTNRNSHGLVAVGKTQMTWDELEAAVNQGKVIEVIDHENGTITYKFAEAGSKESTTPEQGGRGGKKDLSRIAVD